MAKSAYIHIPFCKQKCNYCSFTSFTNVENISNYKKALETEIKHFYKGELLDTLYFGGGTPSLLTSDIIKDIIKNFNINSNTEITLELNPDDADFEYLKSLRDIGINRLSIGSQTFNDKILQIIGRRHDSKQTIQAVNLAQKAGLENISLDLIYGLPLQTLAILEADLKTLTDLGIQHISTYGLKIEENSYFYKNIPQNLPDDDIQADMYLFINDYLQKYKFKRYEISNFALQGFESKHNLNYWNNKEYYGFGLSAHGYNDGIRYANSYNLSEYIKSPLVKSSSHKQTEQEKLEEEIFLGFRKESGINVSEINKNFNIDFNEKYKSTLNKFIPEFIEKTSDGYKLTIKGVLLSNHILSEFI